MWFKNRRAKCRQQQKQHQHQQQNGSSATGGGTSVAEKGQPKTQRKIKSPASPASTLSLSAPSSPNVDTNTSNDGRSPSTTYKPAPVSPTCSTLPSTIGNGGNSPALAHCPNNLWYSPPLGSVSDIGAYSGAAAHHHHHQNAHSYNAQSYASAAYYNMEYLPVTTSMATSHMGVHVSSTFS